MNHQLSAHHVLSRYTTFNGKSVLEVGGAQSCESAAPFLADGAARVVVTGLDHIREEGGSKERGLKVMRADALELSALFGEECFDVVYGLSIIEHIPSPTVFLDEVFRVLRPGGIAYFEGNPIWTSPKGHHLWVATWGGAYQGKATANYLFAEWPGEPSTNPLPDWSHLLMNEGQMRRYLEERSIPASDVDCIVDWVYSSGEVNRVGMAEIAKSYGGSRLIVLEANVSRVDVPADAQSTLRQRWGEGTDFGIYGVSYVLMKPV